MVENVILVDTNDKKLGEEEKMSAHEKGLLHRAFSIFVFNSKGELLLQQRAFHKYHSKGIWANTCCSHPRTSETLNESVNRRLQEELGFTTDLEKKFDFIYKAPVENLIEHEFDHVFVGKYDGEVRPNPDEVHDYKWIAKEQLIADSKEHPEKYAEWFKIIINQYLDKIW
ncbi:MAG: Isopentenyl-diphosphate Delta-isomerase [Candidatus Heimdallarchaeota archaeon LC_3]|nr:MAG: Isopentenyl-diphosphate Delta-isomerase [Candidatus Heimdallarchaeota archaeon LC_3]